MKLKLLLSFALSITITSFFAQTLREKRKCIALEHEAYLQKMNPLRKTYREQYEQQVENWISSRQQKTNKQQALITIPVVVHVVYSNATENISDAQVLSAIKVLNEDFTRTNADTVNTPAVFSNIVGHPNVNWCMAQKDPNGLPTTGIVRKQTTVTGGFGTNDEVKKSSTGGDDAWPTDKYFNIWVCKFSDATLLGYGEFPTATQTNTFGFVASYTCYGTMGTAQAPFDKGRTATHEIGHCLNLRHIWGDANCGNDQVADTPVQQTSNFGCPTHPHVTCNNVNGDMFMNYMDYVDDACMNSFSKGQSTRMLAVLNTGPYASLQNSTVCQPPIPLGPNDAGVAAISSPSGIICTNSISPVIKITNFGSAALSAVTINYNVDGGTNQTYSWTGNLATYASASITLPAITAANGAHTLNISTSLPNASTDVQPANDTKSIAFTVLSAGSAAPLVQDFEAATTWPLPGYTLSNPDGGITWALANVGHSGTKSIYMENFNYNENGELDEIILPAADLSNANGTANFKFWLAYQTYTNPTTANNTWDTLAVLASTDCGSTWTSLYKKWGATLITAATPFSTNAFTPAASDWREENIDIAAYKGNNNVMFKIKHTTNYENNLYIDDINIDFSIGIHESYGAQHEVICSPNPAHERVDLVFKKVLNQATHLTLINMLGEQVLTQGIPALTPQVELNLSGLPGGVYYIQFGKNSHLPVKRIVVQ